MNVSRPPLSKTNTPLRRFARIIGNTSVTMSHYAEAKLYDKPTE